MFSGYKPCRGSWECRGRGIVGTGNAGLVVPLQLGKQEMQPYPLRKNFEQKGLRFGKFD